jgi:hypothetical protein
MIGVAPHLLRSGLAGLCAGLAAVVIAETIYLIPSSDMARVVSATKAAEDVASLTPSDIDAKVAAILGRPLFASSRLSDEKNRDDVPEDTSEPFDGRLSGVAIERDAREALFQGDGEKPVTVKLGDTIKGWTVSVIEPDHVVLKGYGGEKTMLLTDGPRGAPRAPRPPKKAAAAKPAAQNRAAKNSGTKQAAK